MGFNGDEDPDLNHFCSTGLKLHRPYIPSRSLKIVFSKPFDILIKKALGSLM
jgi:hypothetical protein